MELLMLVLEPMVVEAFAKENYEGKFNINIFINIPLQMGVVEVEDRVKQVE